MADERGFFSRWSQRKAQARVADAAPAAPVPAPAGAARAAPVPVTGAGPVPGRVPAAAAAPLAHGAAQTARAEPAAGLMAAQQADAADVPDAPGLPPAPPPPTLAEAQALDAGADVSRFVGRGVAPEVRNTALKRLFSDPHFNVMDGLDTYIDDYNQPDPLPAGMLRQMAQSQFLRLFDDEPAGAGAQASAAGAGDSPHAAPTAPADAPRAAGDLAVATPPGPAAEAGSAANALGADDATTATATAAAPGPTATPEPTRPA